MPTNETEWMAKVLELMLYLSANSSLIPADVPASESAEARDCIPGRCRREYLDNSDSDSSVPPNA